MTAKEIARSMREEASRMEREAPRLRAVADVLDPPRRRRRRRRKAAPTPDLMGTLEKSRPTTLHLGTAVDGPERSDLEKSDLVAAVSS